MKARGSALASRTIPKPIPKPRPIRKTHKNNTRSNKKPISKDKKVTCQRKVLIKPRVLDEKNIKAVENKMKGIRQKNTAEIKKELASQGVKVSGKSTRLLKDIYLYSKLCNININHEQ